MKKLYILLSTYGEGVNNLENVLLTSQPNVIYLIGHQHWNGNEVSTGIMLRDDVVYYRLDSVGVTQSRNFLIKKASDSDYIYFCDDDIVLHNNIYEIICSAYESCNSSVITFGVNRFCIALNERLQSSSFKNRSRFNILSVGTVQISAKYDDVSSITFPIGMGAGTSIPIGDEAVYLSKIMSSGCSVSSTSLNICSHPEESSGGERSISASYARGMTIRKVYGITLGFGLMIPFCLSRLKLFNYSALHIFYFFKGFFRG